MSASERRFERSAWAIWPIFSSSVISRRSASTSRGGVEGDGVDGADGAEGVPPPQAREDARSAIPSVRRGPTI